MFFLGIYKNLKHLETPFFVATKKQLRATMRRRTKQTAPLWEVSAVRCVGR
jgi:hypothetical protein